MKSDRRLLIAVLTMVCLVIAACGSSVPEPQQQAAESVAESGDELESVLPEGATVNKKGQVVSKSGKVIGDAEDFGLSPDSGSGSAGSSSGGTGGAGGGGIKEPIDTGENGPGVSADTIKIGVSYADDAEEANAAIGATTGASQINQRRAWEAMVDYINKHGGVAGGRKLEIVFHRLSVASNEPYDQQDQETCNHWSQDDPVFVSDAAFKTDNGAACFHKNGMVMITTNGLRYKSNSWFQRYPTYLEFDGVDNDSINLMYADNMVKMGFFDEGYKLGIVSWSDPEYANPTKNTLVPRLEKLGIQVSDVTYITTPDSGGEVAGPIAQVANTAVRYKADNITHVMFQDLGANLALFFMQAADRQQYFPRYGMTSASGNTALANTFTGLASQDAALRQLDDSVSIGFFPTIDANPEDIPSWGQSEAKDVCFEQMQEAGVDMEDSNAQALAGAVCDAVWTIRATLNAIPGDIINQQTWYEALARIKQMKVELTGGTGLNITQTKRDGLELAAQMRFFEDCVCFKYVSGPFRIPE